MLAAAVFLVATLAIRSAPKDVLVPDSIALRGVTRAELLYELAGRPPVDLLLIGTSRLEKVSTRRIVRQLDRSEISVLNLSVPRNSFFTIETVLRNNPTLLRNLSIIFVDIYPYQFDNRRSIDFSNRLRRSNLVAHTVTKRVDNRHSIVQVTPPRSIAVHKKRTIPSWIA